MLQGLARQPAMWHAFNITFVVSAPGPDFGTHPLCPTWQGGEDIGLEGAPDVLKWEGMGTSDF